MAHWISSKLKAAETILQQIDQQAAESLGKNDKPQSDDIGVNSSPISPEAKPLIKDQLKKKVLENVVNLNINRADKRSVDVISRSNSDVNRDGEARVLPELNTKSNSVSGLTDSDWTELLSVPDKKGGSGGGSLNRSNGVLGIQGLKKDGKKVVNLGSLDGKSEKGRNNGVSKSLRKSRVGLENKAYADSDERTSNVSNVTPCISSVQSPTNGSELDQRGSNSSVIVAEDDKNVTNNGISEANGIVDGEKLHTTDDPYHSSGMMSTSSKRKLDMKVRLKDGERLKSRTSESNGSIKKVHSSPSDGGSNSETYTSSSSDSESEREREERRKRRQQILAEKAAAKAIDAIKEHENSIARLEGEKQSLEKILEERAKQQVQEASELQSTTMEIMEAVDLEKQKHNYTRMEAFSRLTKLESANADLTRSLAHVQKSFQVQVDHVSELHQQIHMKEAIQEELRRKISITHQSDNKLLAPKGVEFEVEMLEAEYLFMSDKVERMKEKVKTLEISIEQTQREIENPTEVEIELKRRLGQLTDHLIQKQAQVETLSSEKATLHFRIEAVSRLLDENKAMTDSVNFPGTSSRDDLESGIWKLSNTKLRPFIKERMQSGQQHFGSLVRQLDSLYCTGYVFLRRNSTARIWCVIYVICLHLWVIYILMSHSPVSDDNRSGAAISLENINNTGSV